MRNRLLLLAFLLIGTTALAEPARVALVIGNAAYSRAALANPINDARAMTQALQAVGFRVTTLENADRKSMKQAVNAFAEQLAALRCFTTPATACNTTAPTTLSPSAARWKT